jgi:hypothetical protein
MNQVLKRDAGLGWRQVTSRRFEIRYAVAPEGGRPIPFPIDMLRYDGSFPYEERDSWAIVASSNHDSADVREVVLMKLAVNNGWNPQTARWRSYGWEARGWEMRMEADGR